MGNMSRMTAERGDSVKQPRKPVAGFALGGGIGDANILDNPLLALMGGQGGQANQRRQDLNPLQKIDQSIAMGNAMGELSNTERYQLSNPTNAAYGIGGPAPGSSAAASKQRQQTDIQSTLRDKLSQQPLYQQGFADGGKPETAEELLARLSGKYGVSSKSTPEPAPQPAPQPVQQQVTNPGVGHGIVNILKGRREQIDKASGYANGGKIKGPGTPTSDSIDANVKQTGEPIKVSTDERILSKAQDVELSKIASDMGFPSLDSWLETMTGKPVGPTMKGGIAHAATGGKNWWEKGETVKLSEEGSKANKFTGENRPDNTWPAPAIDQGADLIRRAAAGEFKGQGGMPIQNVLSGSTESAKPLGIAAEAASNNQGSPRSIAMGADADAAMHDKQRPMPVAPGGIARIDTKGQSPLFTNIDPGTAAQQLAGMKSGAVQMGSGEKDPGWINDAYGNDMRPTLAMKAQLADMERARYGRDMQADIKDPRVIAAAALNLQRMNQNAASDVAQQQAQQQGISAGLDQQVKRNSLAEYASLQKAIADMEKMPDGPQRDAAMEGIAARQSRSLPDKSQLVHLAGGSDPNDPLGARKLPDRLFSKDRRGMISEVSANQQQSSFSQADVDKAIKDGKSRDDIAQRIKDLGKNPKDYGL